MKRFFVILFILIFSSSFEQFGSLSNNIVKTELFQSFEKVHAGSRMKFALKGTIADSWHINSSKPNEEYLFASNITIDSTQDFKLLEVKYPEAHEYNFDFSEVPVSVYEGEILLGGIIEIPEDIAEGNYEVPVKFTYQACNNVTCMSPVTVEDTLRFEVVDNNTQIQQVNAEIFSGLDLAYDVEKVGTGDDSLAATLESSGLLVSLLLVFLGGLALNLTPCVYPLIPITIGYFGGQSEGRTGKLFILGLLYVLGMSVTYSVIGVVTSLSGAVFGTLLQNPIVILFIAAVFVVLSLSMFGVYEFKLPNSWVMKAGGAKSGAAGALFMGLTMGIVAAPCIGPFVLGLVTYVAAKGDPFIGFLMFFFLAIGLGTPYLFLALFSGKIKQLPRAGFWMDAVKHIFGFILIGMAIYFITPLLPKEIGSYILPVFGILAGLFLLFLDKKANGIKGFRIFKYIFSLLIIAVSIYILVPTKENSPDWQTFTEIDYQQAVAGSQKIVIDFYADWCIPCKELDAMTFSDPRVIEKMNEFTAFKVDMTKTLSDETEKIRNEFNIVGMPTVLIINSNGKEVERLTGFVDADQFLKMISNLN